MCKGAMTNSPKKDDYVTHGIHAQTKRKIYFID